MTPPVSVDELVLTAPNLTGHFAGALRFMWETHGLGPRCLLVSESRAVAAAMKRRYPETEFLSSNLHPDLFGRAEDDAPDFEWDVLEPPPPVFGEQYSSVISHALLEHVIDPVCAFRHMLAAVQPGFWLYVMTVLPSFHLHRFPKDYVRFHLDWFEDIGVHMERYGLRADLEDFWAREGVVRACYRRTV